MSEVRNVNVNLTGLWAFGWLFTIGLCQLSFWQGLWALFVWSYYLGVLAERVLPILLKALG